MNWSLNEIETLARRAARGAGFDWGMAEEAGRAARWLASIALPGPEALADLLEAHDGTPHALTRPRDVRAATWHAEGGTICPIAAGTALCDLARGVVPVRDVTVEACAQPLLLVPFMAMVAQDCATELRMTWAGGDFAFAADLRGHTLQSTGTPETVRIRPAVAPDLPLPACQLRYDLDAAPADRLTRFARRIYAPDSAESRLSGAGAGLSDND